ncbi:hypothetical protein [Streptomyces tailanensis]|uniref:hypothetical protein n=1 Tax=Streptomyces tailanensis TaxID=2569858 RepID=UPI00122EA069|nr:hypothetical protein [Streptomyces tailanensis]
MRRVRGRRYRLGSLLALCLVAVLGGAASLAVDGKAVHGSRTDGATVHLLAAALHACQPVIAQWQIAVKRNEIPAFASLLDRIDLRGVVVTADAMRTQRAHAGHVITVGGHYLLVATRRSCASSCETCPGARFRCGPAPPGSAAAARSAV